jgi:hypothetical protein
MSRRSNQSHAKSTPHSETQSQRQAKAKGAESVGIVTKAKDGTLTTEVRSDNVLNGVAADDAAPSYANVAKHYMKQADEAIANANRLAKVVSELKKKAPSTSPRTQPTPTASKRKSADAPGVPRKRQSTVPDKLEKPPKRNSGPFFDASLAAPRPPKPAVVDASLNKGGYSYCAFDLFFPSFF